MHRIAFNRRWLPLLIAPALLVGQPAFAADAHAFRLAGAVHERETGAAPDPGKPAWNAPGAEVARRNPVKADAASVRRGRQAYRNLCVGCHGDAGRGDGPAGSALKPRPTDLVTHGPHHSDGDLAWKIRTGRGPMPAFGAVLGDRQVWDTVNYLRTLARAAEAAPSAADDHGTHRH